jgi:hypothetical protein
MGCNTLLLLLFMNWLVNFLFFLKIKEFDEDDGDLHLFMKFFIFLIKIFKKCYLMWQAT